MARTRYSRSEAYSRKILSLYVGVVITITAGMWLVAPSGKAGAQVAPITPSGLETQVSDPIVVGEETRFDITGGTRPGGGTNLFHSFGNFNVPENTVASFRNDSMLPTVNIIGRVTGHDISNIFGTIQTMGFDNANLFLMNPAGFLFGPNATLDTGGSVAFTSASYLRLEDGNRFTAAPAPSTDNLLTASPIAAFGFLGSNPGAIIVRGSEIKVPEGVGITLVGGNITIGSSMLDNGTLQRAHVSAPSGQIQLASTASPGEFDRLLLSLSNVDGNSFQSFGSATFAPDSTVNVSGSSTVSIRGNQFVLSVNDTVLTTAVDAGLKDTISLKNQSNITSSTLSEDNAGDILLKAGTLNLTHSNLFTSTEGKGNAGSILLGSTILQAESSLISSQAIAPLGLSGGKGGTIELAIGQAAKLSNTSLDSQTTTNGDAGNIFVTADSLTLATSQLTTGTTPNYLQTGFTGGHAGNIEVNVNNLTMKDGLIVSQSSFSTGSAGTVTIKASESVAISGTDIFPFAVSTLTEGAPPFCPGGTCGNGGTIAMVSPTIALNGVGLNSTTTGIGNAGDILVKAKDLTITNGAQITASAEGPVVTGAGGTVTIQGLTSPALSVFINGMDSGIFTKTEGTGAGGTINLSTRTLTMQNGGTISAGTLGIISSATGGSITVKATDHVTLTNGASISASSTGPANAGKIFINAGQRLDLTNGSSITTTTQSAQANGGNIDIRAIDRVRLVNSTISTSVRGDAGSGGNIFIDPNVVILEGSKVTAQAVGGSGGNITFITPLFLADSASLVSASSERGPSGTVTIQSPTSNLSGTVGQLVSKTSPPQVLLQNRCIALAGGEQSTFILAGRDALPSEPGGWLSSPVAMEHWTREEKEHASGLMVRNLGSNTFPSMTSRRDESTILPLRRLTPPGFLVRTFAAETTGCLS